MASVQFYNGKVLFVDGKVAMDPACCCTTSNPCDPNPEMLLTVSGSSGTINWCGETWNLPGDSGVQKSVCPTDYKPAGVTTTYESVDLYSHHWYYNSSLKLLRRVGIYNGTLTFNGKNSLVINSVNDYFGFFYNTLNSSSVNLGVFTSGKPASPTYSDDAINSDFFQSYTTGGVTYTWQKGAGW